MNKTFQLGISVGKIMKLRWSRKAGKDEGAGIT